MIISTTATTVTFEAIERLALQAHGRGDGWSTFWPQVANAVVEMAASCPVRFERLRDRLLCVLTTGTTSGLEPPGDPWGGPEFLCR